MRVLRLIGSLDPAHGGPSVSAVSSAIASQRAGAETTFAFVAAQGTPDPPAVARLHNEGVRTERFAYCSAAGQRGVAWGVSAGLLERLRHGLRDFDIVQCHGAWQMATAAALAPGGEGRARCVLTPHESLTDHDVEGASRRSLGLVKQWLRARILTRFDRIVYSSEIEARDSVPAALAGVARSGIVLHAVFDERAAAQPVAARPGRGEALRIGFLGRLHAKKNVAILIEALAHAPGVRLRIAGDGPERERLRALAGACGVADRIEWLGFIGEAEKQEFLAEIDVLAMVSDYECFGMAIAEAMVAGVPVIVSEETGVTPLVRDAGAGLVAARKAEAVADAFNRMAADENTRLAMGARAAKAARDHLSFAAHGAAMAACYEALLADGRCPGI
ncbi:MAG: glycosyltransferase [Alphaproteobacteria bacterium]|nr:glycosyltransferase [Alphaproteobacteria bacterium]